MLTVDHIATHPPEVHDGHFVRHRCRNPRCQGKLARPTDTKRHAFCCDGCRAVFYKNRCVVCEAELSPGPANRQICRRKACRAEWRKFPQTYQGVKFGERPPRSTRKTGLKTGTKVGRPYRQIAGPGLSPISLRLASLPLDPEFAARIRRANGRAHLIGPKDWSVELIGGRRRGRVRCEFFATIIDTETNGGTCETNCHLAQRRRPHCS
jgi:hypothetical protein